ncbi:MAG: hypothetical protein QOI41_7178, partial [Myxococcales bacterium]|nr:hypothetical protein [Myxococcales bacterium]
RAFFDSGVGHFDRSEWSAALADFLRSRALFPTKAATKNAAVCFRREGRFDESLETFEALLREFPDLAPGDRAFAEKESAELRGAIGSIEIAGAEPGAAVVIDGRARGSYPTSAPLRVAAGSHVVRVYKEGFGPFEARVDVAGRQSALVEAHLSPLTQAGRLSVTESGGRALDVVIDNVVVGKTPWEGAIAVGLHAVVLRGEGDLGTQPATTTVRLGDVTTLALAAEPLTSTLRIVPVPAGANVSIDAVVVGQGVWEGKLREGEHVVEVIAEGFLLARRVVRLTKSERTAETVVLERDPSSPLWRAAHPARVFVEIDVGPAVGLAFGGDVRSACSGACSAAIPIGLAATAHAGYELSSGITLGLDAGYLVVAANVSKRAASVLPKGLAPNAGTLDDSLGIQGVRFGPSAGYRTGEDWPVTFRFGAGIFLGAAVDARKGTFTTSTGATYDVDVSESPSTAYVYLAPEFRVARRFPSRLELSAGVAVLAMMSVDQPSWSDRQPVLAAPKGQQGDGVATFGAQTLAGGFLLSVVPSVGARYAF